MILLYLLVLLTTPAYSHNPLVDPNICGAPICKGGTKFKYGPGTQHNYKYTVQIKSLFNGTSQNESTMYIQATASLSFLSPCDGKISLSEVTLKDDSSQDTYHPKSMDFAGDLAAYPLRFSFEDGIITELCPRKEELQWVLNFKRGLLSMIHNSMKRFDLNYVTSEESDVRGKCPTKYTVMGAKETSLLIEKTKQLDSCIGRARFHSMIQSTPWPASRRFNMKDNIVKSSSHCLVSVDHNIYKEIQCEESHLLEPFSNNGAGASTVVAQSLVLEEEMRDMTTEEPEIIRREPLNFDHSIVPRTKDDKINEIDVLLKKAEKSAFTELVQTMRELSFDSLQKVHKRTKAQAAKKHFISALPYVRSGASVTLMKDLILAASVPESTINEWMISIAFIASPNDEMMEAVLPLLRENAASPNIALSVATLAHTYCSQRAHCQEEPTVRGIVSHLEKYFLHMLSAKSFDRQTTDNIMVTLKALSNIGVISEDFELELFKVIANSNLASGIRVAAVETFRRTPCEKTRSYFESIFRNQDEDAEVRIASYLQIMRCPNYLLIRAVRHSLLVEEVNQVGSFVWSHLSNLIETAVPNKVEIQSLLSDKDLVKKFSSDIRKFSRNFEGSMYFEDYNVGGTYESNIIFSPSSYIPKSGMLNISVDVFGESVNIFEVYGRIDGFEHYLESFFGPKGSSKAMKDNIMDKLRWPRSIKDNEVIKSQVDELPNVMDDVAKDPKVALGLKVFGNEVKYTTFSGDSEIRQALQTLDPVYHLKRILSGKEINYSKAAMFLDSKYVVPSAAGLPLSLSATGAASINIKLYGSLASAGFSKDRELQVDLSADIEPTVSVDVTGEMAVDAFHARTGIKLKANMFTDSAVKADIKVRGSRLASLKFSLPRETNEIFSASSELLVRRKDKEEPQVGDLTKRVDMSFCSWPAIDKMIGLKVCTEYNYVNVTRMDNIPYFLVAGPAGFRCYLHKSDRTAKDYVFEYKWVQHKEASVVSLTFDTPGSTVKRLVSANLTLDRQTHNVTLLLQSGAGTVLARGKYKNTVDEKFIQVALDINNKKHFDAIASIKRSRIKNGFSYKPLVYLGVNDDRVLKFSGYVDLLSKKGISQYTVDLNFETKRLNSRLYGYISKSDTSIEASLFNDYKFQYTKEQRVSIKFGAANRSKKNMVVFVGFCNLNSTAYPNMNVAANSTFQKSGGHMDLSLKLKQNPLTEDHPDADHHTLNFDVLLSYKSFTDNKRVFKVVSSLNRKSTNLALKGEIVYEAFRHDVNLVAVVKYGGSKQVSVTVFWSHPRSALEQIKTHINITIPSFTPMILKLDVDEKQPNDYMIDFHGTWFSGHSISMIGFYQDKSTAQASHHHVKCFVKSPSFKDLNIDLQFYRDNDVLKLDVKALSNNTDEYQVYFHHQAVSDVEVKTQAKFKNRNKLYTFESRVYDGEHRRIDAELHIDQIRDIDFSVYIYNMDNDKSVGLEIHWDANRDPSQNLVFKGSYKKNAAYDYVANFMIMYPGKFVKGDYRFLLEKGRTNTLAYLEWDTGTFSVDVDIVYDFETKWFLQFSSKMVTPFDHWKKMTLAGRFDHEGNKYDIHGVMSWNRRERVAVDIFGDYESNGSYFTCKYSCSIASSIDRVPNINTTVSHRQNKTNFDTNLFLMYNPEFVIGLDSQWKIESDNHTSNLTGTIHSRTPFKGLANGVLAGKIFIMDNNYMKGYGQLDIDHKKMSIDMEGKFKKLTNCMLMINLTAPESEYKLRFVISAEQRTFIAMLTYPTGSFGTEVIFLVHSLIDFDTKFHLATPVEFLQDIIVAAKLKPEEADFRVGWNFLLLGFSGVWHYGNVLDFNYSYKIYTPIEDFDENGVVGRLVFKEGLDLEVSAKLSQYKNLRVNILTVSSPLRKTFIKLTKLRDKDTVNLANTYRTKTRYRPLGVKLLGQPKPKHFKEMGIKIKDVYLGSNQSGEERSSDDPLNWEGLIELDAIIYPTMKGELEIEQKGNSYVLQSKLTMPHGVAHIFDEFEYIDILTLKNSLRINTPYPFLKTIYSDFNLEIKKGSVYLFGLSLDLQKEIELHKSQIFAQYRVQRKEPDERRYNVTLKVLTPFEAFPKLNLFGAFETEENFYRTMLLFNTNRSDISVDATTEIDSGVLELISNFHVKTPAVYIPSSQLRISKLTSPNRNFVEMNLDMPEKLRKEIYMRASWLLKSRKDFYSMVKLETPFNGLENTTAGMRVYISDEQSTIWSAIQMNPLEVEINSTLRDSILNVASELNFNGKRFPLLINCKILQPEKRRAFDSYISIADDYYEFDGQMTLKEKVFVIAGYAEITEDSAKLLLPSRVFIQLDPVDESPEIKFNFQVKKLDLNKYKFEGGLAQSDRYVNYESDVAYSSDKLNWEIHTAVLTSTGGRFHINTKVVSEDNGVNLSLDMTTPIFKLENVIAGATYNVSGLNRNVYGFFEIINLNPRTIQAKGSMDLNLVWLVMEDMAVKAIGKFENVYYSSQSSVLAFYQNPGKTFYHLKVGGDVAVDKIWEAASNITVKMPPNKTLGFEGHLKTPYGDKESHSLYTELEYADSFKYVDYLVKYRALESQKKYGSWGQISIKDKQNLTGNVEVQWDGRNFNNFANLKMSEKQLDLIYKLKTPKFDDKRTLVAQLGYIAIGERHNLTCDGFYPEDQSVIHATVDYKELANMNGMFNITLPYKALNYTGAYFSTLTNESAYNRYIKVFWDGDNAVLDGKCDIHAGPTSLDRTMRGKLIVELPLATRHIAVVDYEFDKKPAKSIGQAVVNYNGSQVLEGKYDCLTETKPGSVQDTVHAELKNSMVPIGADYIHRHQTAIPGTPNEFTTSDNKFLHLYHLQNRSNFNITGQLDIVTTPVGEKYILTAVHSNRTVRLQTGYSIFDHKDGNKEYQQQSRLDLGPKHWIEYDVSLINKTQDEIFDAQQIVISVIYPKRSFTAQGFYNISDSIISTDMSLVWDKDNKTVQAGLDWRRVPHRREQLLFQIKHPSFEKDVSFYSEYGYNKSAIDGQLVVDYSLNSDQRLTLGGKVGDNSKSLIYNYTYNVWAQHNATNLNLNSEGMFYWSPSDFGTKHFTNYQRSYLPPSTAEALARVNLDDNEIELKKDNLASGLFYFWGKYAGHYPLYTANMTSIHESNHSRGELYANFNEKLLYVNINMTEDGSQSMHTYGNIPDARNVRFNMWRHYDDRTVSDVSYYLSLNHSRLVTSALRWRPQLMGDVQGSIRGSLLEFYLETLETINNTKQYMRAEALDAVNGIWMDAKPNVEKFLADLRNLTVIEDDFEEFKIFLNESYYANEFYIRTITNIVVTMFDELALKSHFQSLPKIVQEIWSVMGESGQKIKKSILWVVDKIKLYYKNTTQFIHELINGDPIEHITKVLKKVVERYDEFIKNVHVTVLQYVESLWTQTYNMVIEHWHKTLAALEPAFLRFIHYVESMLWHTGKELLDFLYQRKNEIIESPYFVQFTKLSHDVDRFYKDMTGNNTIANLYKYAHVAWNFLKEKYLNSVPFGKEVIDIISEVLTELKKLTDIPSINFLVMKWNQATDQFKYYYDYFDMENRLQRLVKLMYLKLSDMSVTALEDENRHRVAKTKFVFEPDDGIMLLEQKLPMSWHAFNETPKFKEIPEIKRIYSLATYIEASQSSFWDLYYNYKLFMDPEKWLPPFKGHAMVVGSKYYITFDKRYYDFEGRCTYLLARDSVDRNFTLLVAYNENRQIEELLLLLNNTMVHVNMKSGGIQIGDSDVEYLPAQIGEAYLYRDAGVFYVTSEMGFALECNIKFKICTFQMSGWYSGKTAGLWGTYNNEPSDDFLMSNKSKAHRSRVDAFGDSWSLQKDCKAGPQSPSRVSSNVPRVVQAACEEFFTSKVSQLSTCFSRIPKESFLYMCLNSTSLDEACSSAVSYISLCALENTPLRIPDTCVRCNLPNGTEIQEGDFIRLQGSSVPQTADIVFIVEAKECNKDLKNARNLDVVVELLEKELAELNITDNRYAVVAFGGKGVYDEPRSVILGGQTFTDVKSVSSYFGNIPVGQGNSDVFNAVMFAYNLIFRPGVSRSFILLPCSECTKNNMEYDYATIHQLLSESGISLHILMNDHFTMHKEREVKIPFGIDRRFAYSKKDVRALAGDPALRKAIMLPKSSLGVCLPLAMETNGTVFSAKHLETDKKSSKKFSAVFTKAVARSAVPRQCIDCECVSESPTSGVSFMECYICTTTNFTRNNFEILGLDDDLANMNMLDGFSF